MKKISITVFLVLFNTANLLAQETKDVWLLSLTPYWDGKGIPTVGSMYRQEKRFGDLPPKGYTPPVFGPFYPTNHTRGDREFIGLPKIEVTVRLQNLGHALHADVTMKAEETRDGDPVAGPPSYSTVEGHWNFVLFYPDPGYRIRQVHCSLISNFTFTDSWPTGELDNFKYDLVNPSGARENNLAPQRDYPNQDSMTDQSDPVFYYYVMGNTQGEDFGGKNEFKIFNKDVWGYNSAPSKCSVSFLLKPIRLTLEN